MEKVYCPLCKGVRTPKDPKTPPGTPEHAKPARLLPSYDNKQTYECRNEECIMLEFLEAPLNDKPAHREIVSVDLTEQTKPPVVIATPAK